MLAILLLYLAIAFVTTNSLRSNLQTSWSISVLVGLMWLPIGLLAVLTED